MTDLETFRSREIFRVIKCFVIALVVLAAIALFDGAFAKSCTRRVAEDYHALEAATLRLNKACKADLMGEKCTLAIEDGDRVVEASNRLKLSCPDVSWSYDAPQPWTPDAQ